MSFNPFDSINIPERVYKYRDWNNKFHKRILTDCELFLASPAMFNDPFDCKIPVAYWKLAENKELAQEYFHTVVDRYKQDLSPEDKSKEVERLIAEGRFRDDKFLLTKEDDFFKGLNEQYGVISLTSNPKNVVMWSHYSNSHKGFCVGFNSRELFNNSDHFGRGGKVIYLKDFPEILPTEDLIQQLIKQMYIKSDLWGYEDEYRLSKFEGSNMVVNFSPETLCEVILGCSINKSNKDEIVEITKANFPNAEIYQSKQVRKTFKIKFEKVV